MSESQELKNLNHYAELRRAIGYIQGEIRRTKERLGREENTNQKLVIQRELRELDVKLRETIDMCGKLQRAPKPKARPIPPQQ